MGVLHVVHTTLYIKISNTKTINYFQNNVKNYPNAPLLIGLMKSKSSISGAYNEE